MLRRYRSPYHLPPLPLSSHVESLNRDAHLWQLLSELKEDDANYRARYKKDAGALGTYIKALGRHEGMRDIEAPSDDTSAAAAPASGFLEAEAPVDADGGLCVGEELPAHTVSLFVAGRVVYLEGREDEVQARHGDGQMTTFQRIIISPWPVEDHQIKSYAAALRKVWRSRNVAVHSLSAAPPTPVQKQPVRPALSSRDHSGHV